MKKYSVLYKTLLLLFLTFGFGFNANAQLFKAGVAAGFNAAQIEGDDMNGYKKFGLNAGVLMDVNINEKFAVGFEILYSQKGSRGNFFNDNDEFFQRKIKLDYIEIPILFKYRDSRGMDFGGGISIARLVSKQYKENGTDFTLDYFSVTEFEDNDARNFDFNIVLDAAYNINSRFQIGARWSYSLGAFQRQFSSERAGRTGQFHNVLALRFSVFFTAQEEKDDL